VIQSIADPNVEVLAEFARNQSAGRGPAPVADRSVTQRFEEYTALRNDLRSLRNSSFAFLGGTLAVSGIAVWRWLDFVQASKDAHANVLALFLAYIVVTAMALSCRFYDDGFRIAAYLEVFHEGRLGWQQRNRGMGGFIGRRGTVQRRSLANLLEPRLVAYLYLPLVVAASLLILASPVTAVRTWSLAPAALALGAGTYLFLKLGFFLDRRDDWWRWWWSEYGRLEDTEPGERPQPLAEGRHDPATTVIGLLLLVVALLFILGLVLQPPIQ
jgi:hypothetical protein